MNILPLATVDETSRTALTAIPSTYPLDPLVAWGGKPVDSVWVENVLDYLDDPGGWAVDTTKGKIYYWPVGDNRAIKSPPHALRS